MSAMPLARCTSKRRPVRRRMSSSRSAVMPLKYPEPSKKDKGAAVSSMATRMTGWCCNQNSSASVSCSLRSVRSRSLPALQRLKILARTAAG
ncbi:hypothetical protein D3C80_1461180 [compost metagenome]